MTLSLLSTCAYFQLLALKYKYPPCLKFCVTPLHFHERPTLAPISANQKKSSDFHSYEKKAKSENSVQVFCFPVSYYRGGMHSEQWEWLKLPAKLLPGERQQASQHQSVIALTCICEHLCLIWVYFVHSCFYHMLSVISGLMRYLVWCSRLLLGVKVLKFFSIIN